MFKINPGARLQGAMTNNRKENGKARFATKGSTELPQAERPARTYNSYFSYYSYRKKFEIFDLSVATARGLIKV